VTDGVEVNSIDVLLVDGALHLLTSEIGTIATDDGIEIDDGRNVGDEMIETTVGEAGI
jgi:hypothetical protein